jgi:ankyrin repeat protein
VLSTGATPLLRAAKGGDNPAAIALLLAHHALVDLPTATGVTPVMTAAGMGHGNNPSRGRFNTEEDGLAAVKLLLDGGANIHARAADGQTALHGAAQKGWNNVIAYLIERGASPKATDLRGRTPLDYAKGLPDGRGRGSASEAGPETIALLEKLTR